MAELRVENLVKRHGAFVAIDNVGFTVGDGEFVTLLGPSGCGKSTTLAAIAGLDHPDSGVISAGGVEFFNSRARIALPPEARNCGLVFQAYALWPHMRVRENVDLPLRLRKLPRPERKRLVDEALALVEMQNYADRYPHELSGGQQQRVALARTLVYKPDVLLLDEPLSNLDSKLRERARTWLSELHRRVRQTTIYVTHDQTEALALSDRIIVMNAGSIVQIGTPDQIYNHPANAFVADFIGTSTFLTGIQVDACDSVATVRMTDGQTLRARADMSMDNGAKVTVAIRPERLELIRGAEGAAGQDRTLLRGRVLSRSYLGARFQYDLDVCGEILKVESLDRFDDPELSIRVPVEACIVVRS
jgi:iron(III) transport system ATP-binding protein